MTVTTTVIEDTADHTITRVVDTVLKRESLQTVYKPGSAQFNDDALQAVVAGALATLNTAETLLQAGGAAWDNAAPAARTALVKALVQDVRALIRISANLLDSPT